MTEKLELEVYCQSCQTALKVTETDICWNVFKRFFFTICGNCGADVVLASKMVPPDVHNRVSARFEL